MTAPAAQHDGVDDPATGGTIRVTDREFRDACALALIGAGVVPAEAGPAAGLAAHLHRHGADGIALVVVQTRRPRVGRAPIDARRDGSDVHLPAGGPRSVLLLAEPAADLLGAGATVHLHDVALVGDGPWEIAAYCADRARRPVLARYGPHARSFGGPYPSDTTATCGAPDTLTLSVLAAHADPPGPPTPSDLAVSEADWARLESLARRARRTDPTPPTLS